MPFVRPSPFRDAFLIAAAFLAVTSSARTASAQACCAGAAALGTGRLVLHEEALIGLDLRATDVIGSFAADAQYRSAKATQVELEQGIFGTLRVLEKGQVTLRVPFVETFHSTRTRSELGGGPGDIAASARWDFVLAGESLSLPGMGVFAGVVLPTGRPIEKAEKTLGTDATGTGATQLSAGFGVEQTFGDLFVGVIGSAVVRLPREVRGSTTPTTYELAATAAFGLLLPKEAVVVLSSTFTIEPETPQRMLRLGLSGALPLDDRWRLQGGPFSDVPIDGIGQNQSVGTGFLLAFVRSWS